MRKLIMICLIIWSIPILSSAQEDTQVRSKIYRTWVLGSEEAGTIKGILYSAADSSVMVATSMNKHLINKNDLFVGAYNLSKVHFKDIYNLKVRRHNSVPRNMLIFSLVGASVGAIIGAIAYEPSPTYPTTAGDSPSFAYSIHFTQAESIGIGAVTGTICGLGVGALTGLIKIKIPINANIDTFSQNKSRLEKYSYLQ